LGLEVENFWSCDSNGKLPNRPLLNIQNSFIRHGVHTLWTSGFWNVPVSFTYLFEVQNYQWVPASGHCTPVIVQAMSFRTYHLVLIKTNVTYSRSQWTLCYRHQTNLVDNKPHICSLVITGPLQGYRPPRIWNRLLFCKKEITCKFQFQERPCISWARGLGLARWASWSLFISSGSENMRHSIRYSLVNLYNMRCVKSSLELRCQNWSSNSSGKWQIQLTYAVHEHRQEEHTNNHEAYHQTHRALQQS
jgi:hypothetical protein